MPTPSPADAAGASHPATPVYIRGVPHALPPDEHLLWEGAPDGSLVSKHVFHRGLVMGYLVLVTGWWLVESLSGGVAEGFLAGLALRLAMCALVVGVVEFLGRAVARTTVYAITSKRIVLKIGIVLPMTINVPLRALRDAGFGRFRDGSGQISLTLLPEQRLAYIALWPHCRVFSFTNPQPVLRGLRDGEPVASILRDAIVADADASGLPVTRVAAAVEATRGNDAVLMPTS